MQPVSEMVLTKMGGNVVKYNRATGFKIDKSTT